MSNIKNPADVENTPLDEKKRIWYLCDGERPECSKNFCYKNTDVNPCRHTSDIEHAVNFTKEERGGRISYREEEKTEESRSDLQKIREGITNDTTENREEMRKLQ